MVNTFTSRLPWLLLLVVSFQLRLPISHAEMLCEDIPVDYCAFSVSTSGKRCVLEHYVNSEGKKEYQCRTSGVVVGIVSEHIEKEECVRACGVDRKMAGISSDALLEPQFMAKLCSPACYGNCPYIVDLYFNLAAGEGGYLPTLCEKQRMDPHREMVELMSSGAAPGPVSPDFSEVAVAPGPALPDFSEVVVAPGPVSPDFSELTAVPGPSFAPAPRRSLFGFSI